MFRFVAIFIFPLLQDGINIDITDENKIVVHSSQNYINLGYCNITCKNTVKQRLQRFTSSKTILNKSLMRSGMKKHERLEIFPAPIQSHNVLHKLHSLPPIIEYIISCAVFQSACCSTPQPLYMHTFSPCTTPPQINKHLLLPNEHKCIIPHHYLLHSSHVP